MEDFVDRYDNIRMAGPHEQGFAPDRYGNYLTPCLFNSRVYSCILLDTTMDLRWRGKYNEDTDLSLRILKQGDCTALFRALLMDKGTTSAGGALSKSKSKAMKGGNTEHVYNSNDYRKRFAESLRDQHPDCVKVVWRFHRWHHLVDYSKFARNQPILRKDVTPIPENNEYQMELVHKQSDHKDTTCAQEKPVRKRVPSGMRRRRS